ERPLALMRAELAMIGVIDRDQRVDAGFLRSLQLQALQLALVLRQRYHAGALQPNRGLVEVDDLDAGHRLQQLEHGFADAGDAGMAMQRDGHANPIAEMRTQFAEPATQEAEEWCHLERL